MFDDIQGVLFDKDGTLFDFQASWARATAQLIARLAGSDRALADRLHRVLGFDPAQGRFLRESPFIAGTQAETLDLVGPLLPAMPRAVLSGHMSAMANTARMAEAVPLRPLMDDLLSAGLRLGVATNDGEDPARRHLDRAGVLDRFHFVAGYDSGFGAKPDPGMVAAFAQAMALAPGRVVMVGDSTHDLLAGRAAGMRTVGVLTGVAEAADLTHLADAVVPDIGHLPALLGLARG